MSDLYYISYGGSDSGSDSEGEEPTPRLNPTNPHTDAFRTALSEWKKKQLDSILGENQDTIVLNRYVKSTNDLYTQIKNYIENKQVSEEMDASILKALGDPMTYSTDTRITILHAITRDLIEFPFTFDIGLIKVLDKKDAAQLVFPPIK